jgi:AAA+ ATPase superfamily predicted ATPase
MNSIFTYNYLVQNLYKNSLCSKNIISFILNDIDVNFSRRTRHNCIKIYTYGEIQPYETRHNYIKTYTYGEIELSETRHNYVNTYIYGEIELFETRHNCIKIYPYGEIELSETRHNYIFYTFVAGFKIFNMNIIGRISEQKALKEYVESDKSEFMVIYGRRRVGKTFLIKEFFNNKFAFHVTGLANTEMRTQLENFNASLQKYGNQYYPLSHKWFYAFEQLIHLLQYSPKKGKKVIFIDEMPWMDTHHSGFITALEHFWNGWASARQDIFLIVCGSATSWMMNKLIKNHGGLHNRVTRRMHLEPFTLGECEDFYRANKIVMSRYEIMESYMILGGIPYYMSLMEKKFSLAQNIDNLCFAKKGALREEFSSLYASLFRHAENHTAIVEILAKKAKGMTRDEILRASKLQGGNLTKTLEELELCGFIRSYNTFNKLIRNKLYQLVDFYTLFYLNYIYHNKQSDEHFWTNFMNSAKHRAWSGYAFEQVCLAHIKQIKQKLGISGVLTSVASWRSRNSEQGAQIDLLIERKDNVINLCEMKYANTEFVIDKKYEQNLRNKRETFLNETKTRKTVHITMVTTYGVKRNEYSGLIQSEVKMDDLFHKE